MLIQYEIDIDFWYGWKQATSYMVYNVILVIDYLSLSISQILYIMEFVKLSLSFSLRK